jgi:hypothetical protein
VDSSGAYIEESTLEYLKEWAKVFFLLLGHISGEIENDPVSTESDIDSVPPEAWYKPFSKEDVTHSDDIDSDDIDLDPEARDKPFSTKEGVTHSVDFPGKNLSEIAHKTWEHHFEVWRPLFRTRRGSFASIMLEKILDQWLEQTKPTRAPEHVHHPMQCTKLARTLKIL